MKHPIGGLSLFNGHFTSVVLSEILAIKVDMPYDWWGCGWVFARAWGVGCLRCGVLDGDVEVWCCSAFGGGGVVVGIVVTGW